jgi:glycerol-3-phosphate acyltransferase PlsY
MSLLLPVGVFALAYVMGSLPFAVWIARFYGVDIFKVGSGNPGATNVLRNLGKKPGYLCFLLDALKGVLPVVLARYLSDDEWLRVIAVSGALLGHSFSLFQKFRGGKGVATTLGGLLAIHSPVTLIGIGIWLIAFFTFRFVSLASILLAISFPISAFIFEASIAVKSLVIVLAILIIVRHRSNISRLMNGTENRFTRKS